MSIPMQGIVGALFNRLGKLGALVKNAYAHQQTQLSAMTDTTSGVVAQYNAESDIQALMGSSYQGLLAGVEGVGGVAQQIADATVNRMVFRDNPQFNQTLTSFNTLQSLAEIIRQMRLQGESVLAMTVGASPSGPTGTGNGACVASVRRPLDGRVLENSFAEVLTLLCSADSYNGTATAGQEPFLLTGEGSQGDVFAFDWPLGSNASTDLNAIDGNSDNGGGNLLTNSGFNTFTDDVPDNWDIEVGAAGVQVFEETGITYDGAAALRLTGDGATLVTLAQQFDSAAGTVGNLAPQSQYPVNLFVRRDGTAAAAGAMVVELVDGNGTVVQDEAGNLNTFTIDLTALTTDWVSYSGSFRTPAIMPSESYVRLRMITALSSGRSVYVDKMAWGDSTSMVQAYVGGPFVAVFAGAVPFQTGDYFTVTVTNSRGAGGTLSTWQTLLYQLFPDVQGNEILFPSSASPTLVDSLIG